MTATTAKFLFDADFGSTSTKPMITVAEHSVRLAQAEEAAYRSGVADAEARAAAEAKQSLAAALTTATSVFDRLVKEMSAVEAKLEAEAVEVAVAAAGKLASALMAEEPQAEITALARDCFRHLIDAPHVAMRVNDALYKEASETLAGIAREHGFEGRLVVLADPGIAPGDCRIEWADGGVVHDRKATEDAIAQLVARYLGARRTGLEPQVTAHDSVGRSQS
jgi:flagellar assembly protein FliH